MSGDSSLVASEYSEPQITDTKIETQYQPPKTYQEKYLHLKAEKRRARAIKNGRRDPIRLSPNNKEKE